MIAAFAKKHWVVLTVIVVFIIALIGVYFAGKSAGKETTAPTVPGDNPSDPLSQQEINRINELAQRLKDDIYAWSGDALRDWDAYEQLAGSSDRIFVGVYNAYKKATGNSLKTDMEGEWYVNFTSGDILQLIRDRFNLLSLA